MLPLPAFLLIAAMTAPITQSQILPVFDLKKFWDAYMALLQNPSAAFSNPTKAWNDMMGAWVVPGGGASTSTAEKPKDGGSAPTPTDKPAARQGSAPIDISTEAALALAVFRREHQINGDQGSASVDRSRWPLPRQFERPQAASSEITRPFAQGLPSSFGGRGVYSPFVSQPFFVALPVRTNSKYDDDNSSDGDNSSSEEASDDSRQASSMVGPGKVIVTSEPYAPPFGGRSFPFIVRPQTILQGDRQQSRQNIIVNQRGDGGQTLLTNGGGEGGSGSISVIQS